MELHPFSAQAADRAELKAYLIKPASSPGEAVKARRMRERLRESGIVSLLPWGKTRGTVVMLHGRGGRKEDAFPVAERFVAAGFRCLCYDARAHGQSGGVYTTYGALETADLSAVIDAAEIRFGTQLFPYAVFGISQGAAVSLQALPVESRIRSAVVVSPFAELDRMVSFSAHKFGGQWVPNALPWAVLKAGGLWAGFDPFEISPLQSAARVTVPVMVVHGGKDKVIPIEQGRRIYQSLKQASSERRWREVPDGYHFNVLAVGGDDLYQEMIEFWYRSISARPEFDCLPVTDAIN